MESSSLNYGSLSYGSSFPTALDGVSALDTFSVNTGDDYVTSQDMNLVQDAILNIQAKLGIDGSAVVSSIDYLLKNTTGGHDHDGSDSKKLTGLTSTHFASLDGSSITNIDPANLATGEIAEDIEISGELTLSGDVTGTPTGGTLSLAALTLTLPSLAAVTTTDLTATGAVSISPTSGTINLSATTVTLPAISSLTVTSLTAVGITGITGALSGTPTSGTLNLSAVTLTLPTLATATITSLTSTTATITNLAGMTGTMNGTPSGGTFDMSNVTLTLPDDVISNANVADDAAIAISKTELENYTDWGDFTPSVIGGTTAGTGTYTNQDGRYTRIGNTVFFSLNINWSAHTGTGDAIITGLPFTAKSGVPNVRCIMSLANWNTSGGMGYFALVQAGTTYAQPYYMRDNLPVAPVQLEAVAGLVITGFYEIDV